MQATSTSRAGEQRSRRWSWPASRANARWTILLLPTSPSCVDELSGGGLKVDAPSKWFDSGEQGVLEDVIAGEATLGWTGTRALDLIGVDAFQPLHAPFLINSYEAEKGGRGRRRDAGHAGQP